MKDLLKSKTILSQENFGPNTIIAIFDSLNQKEKQVLRNRNIDISPIPLQKLFVLLTEKTNTKEVL